MVISVLVACICVSIHLVLFKVSFSSSCVLLCVAERSNSGVGHKALSLT